MFSVSVSLSLSERWRVFRWLHGSKKVLHYFVCDCFFVNRVRLEVVWIEWFKFAFEKPRKSFTLRDNEPSHSWRRTDFNPVVRFAAHNFCGFLQRLINHDINHCARRKSRPHRVSLTRRSFRFERSNRFWPRIRDENFDWSSQSFSSGV